MARRSDSGRQVAAEFASADLGDERRTQRLDAIARKLAAKPDTPFPRALATGADLEGFYRFLRNDAVTFEALLEPHISATVARIAPLRQAIAVHDTSEFRFGGTRQELGRIGKAGRGFLAHLTIAVDANESRDPLGTLAAETWIRSGPTPSSLRKTKGLSWSQVRELPTERARWARGVDAAEKAASGKTSLIHVMDSEADDYSLMAHLIAMQRRWVIRLCHDRRVEGTELKAKAVIGESDIVCTREVPIAPHRRHYGGGVRRRGRLRDARTAKLSISASRMTLKRPSPVISGAMTIDVNVVAARELRPPHGADPIEWMLLTTEPIDTEEQILAVIDAYRARWRIEEFFKALKTGCALEKRQLDSRRTLLNALAIFIPVAWNLLRLRTTARAKRASESRFVLDSEQILVLRRSAPRALPSRLSARAAMMAVAALGGHLKSNGDPGWQVLGRGYQDLLMLVAGFRLGSEQK